MAQLQNTSISDTGFLQLPQGTTAQRPSSPISGMVRYNTDIQDTEYYDGSTWRLISDSHPEATGGTIIDTEIGGVPYRIHVFTTVGNSTFTVSKSGEIEYLIVSGGGAGGSGRHAGGGGAGGLLKGITTITPQSYTITVGAGGVSAPSNGNQNVAAGTNGNNSSAFNLTAIGGGVGGGHPGPTESGAAGGSGGGSGHSGTGGAGTVGQGNNGSSLTNRSVNGAGGGAGTAPVTGFGGESDFSGRGDSGGQGIFSLIIPPGYWFSGGGGGSASPSDGNGDVWIGGVGGQGGGGGGASNGRSLGSRGGEGGEGYNRGGNGNREARTGASGRCDGGSGGANTGGGGGGAAGWGSVGNGRGGNGGSGIVVIRYRRNLTTTTSPTVTGSLGVTQNNPANDANQIIRTNAGAPDGIYWINLPDVGPTRTLCLMNPVFDGGGWMLALKSTRGATFNYDSSFWTTNNTLNPTDLTLQDGDAKYEVFNRFRATECMARFPDVQNGGTMGTTNLGGWIWHEQLHFAPTSLSNFFSTCPITYLLENDEIFNWRGHGNNGPFSAQSVWRKYGFNINIGNGRQRWGFSWNENAPDDPSSQDVAGGIGVNGIANFSAGDQINCCQSYTGINRTMRVEIYVR